VSAGGGVGGRGQVSALAGRRRFVPGVGERERVGCV
jgi:hypothetical protein